MAELIENGNFLKGAAFWDLAVPSVYGPPPVTKINNGALEMSGMCGASMGYLTLNQAVMILSNKSYKIRFEAMSERPGKFLLAIHDPGKGSHLAKILETGTSWTTYEEAFTGIYTTDKGWVREWIRATRDSKIESGKTIGSSLHKVDEPKGSGPIRTYLTMALGELIGTFSVRNISIVEVVPGKP